MADLPVFTASVYHVTGTDEPYYVHHDGRIRPCTPGDEVAARHNHDGVTYAGPDHEPVEGQGA